MFLNKNEIADESERILAIDYGAKRIGIAISDPLKMFPIPLTTIENNRSFWKIFNEILSFYKISKIILGYPLRENGEKTHATDLVEKFYKELESKTKISVEYIDERYSSQIAQQNIINSVVSKKKRRDKGLVDMNAACVLLQDYLNM